MTEQEIIEIYGKSIWDMTPTERAENGLIETWAKLVDQNASDCYDWDED